MSAMHPEVTHVVLPGSERFHRPGSEVMSACESEEMCDITVKVRRKAELPEPDPARPIARTELTAKYGADPADLDAVVKALTPFGMTVKSRNEATHSVEFVGPARAMEAAFGVKLNWVKHRVQVAPDVVKEHVYRGRTGKLQVPASLAGIVVGIFGLDTRPMVKHRKHNPTRASTALPPANSRPWYIPQELAQAYQFPDGDGFGQSIAILEFGGKYLPADLKTFLGLVGLSTANPERAGPQDPASPRFPGSERPPSRHQRR